MRIRIEISASAEEMLQALEANFRFLEFMEKIAQKKEEEKKEEKKKEDENYW